MDPRSTSHRLFPPFRLDPVNAQLWLKDEKVSLRRKTFDVLHFLVEHPGQLVTKTMLLEAVWPEVKVSGTMPATCVAELRRVLSDDARTPRFIETVHRRGYRFVAPVSIASELNNGRAPEIASRPKPLIVGRRRELAQMERWYADVLKGQRRVVLIAGEAGIGKTALVQELLDSIAAQGAALVGVGQCVEQYGAGEAYMPVLEALSRLSREPRGQRVVELLHQFAPTWLAQLPALLTYEDRGRLQNENQGVTQQRMLREMTDALEALTAEVPLVLLLEDLQWSDFSTLELIAAIARRRDTTRLMIVGTYRPVEVLASNHPLYTMKQELELHHYCEELRLKLLSEQEVAEYLGNRVKREGPPRLGSLAALIHARTDGNPLFMINMVDYLSDDAGHLLNSRVVSTREWAEQLRADRLDVPRTVRQMIERNLERLKPDEQEVLEAASVAGAEFSAASVAAALQRSQDEIEACFTRLSRQEQFIIAQNPIAWPDGTVTAGFRFHHALYQEVLYSRVPAGHQLQLHERIAVREEAGYGERVGEVASELAHHYRRANEKRKAIQYFRLAGERAVGRGAMVEAEEHYRSALNLLSELPPVSERDHQELALQMAVGGVLWSSKSWSHPEASSAYARALDLAEKLGENGQLAEVLLGLVFSVIGSGRYKSGVKMAERMLAAAEQSGDRPSLCAAHVLLGQTLIWCARYTDALSHLESGMDYYAESDQSELALMGVDAPGLAGIVHLLLGFPDRARELMKEALSRAYRRNHSFRLGTVHMWGGMLNWLLQDGKAAFEHAQELRRLAHQQPVWTGLADANAGRALMLQGHWEEGVEFLRKARTFFETAGISSLPVWVKLYEVEFFAHRREFADGLKLLDEAIAATEQLAHLRPRALRQRAELLAQEPADDSTIDAAYRAAIESALEQGAKYYELQATTSFARWLKSRGRASEAHSMLADIYYWFREGFDTVALQEAKALLHELDGKT